MQIGLRYSGEGSGAKASDRNIQEEALQRALRKAQANRLVEKTQSDDKDQGEYKIFRKMPKHLRDEIRQDILAALAQSEGNELSKVP